MSDRYRRYPDLAADPSSSPRNDGGYVDRKLFRTTRLQSTSDWKSGYPGHVEDPAAKLTKMEDIHMFDRKLFRPSYLQSTTRGSGSQRRRIYKFDRKVFGLTW
ncbi:hypothetical protein J6590_039597 [Homalodisca vitripennis]|nr:hypothetical protein J6590_039597 [Homalodisca vitripennis]